MAAQALNSSISYAVAKDAFDLIDFYHKHEPFKKYFNQVLKIKSPDVIRFRGRPLRLYIHALSELDPLNKKLYKQVAYGKDLTIKQDAISQILGRYERDSKPYQQLSVKIQTLATDKEEAIFSDEENKEIEEAHKLKEPQRTQAYLKFLNKKDGTEHDDDFKPPTKNETAEVVDKVVKDLESQAVIKAKQGIVKAEQVAGGFGSSLLRGLRSTVSGGASLAGRGGFSALDTAANLVGGRGASSLASTGITVARATANPFILWGIIITIIVLLLFIFPMLQKGSALFPPYDQATDRSGVVTTLPGDVAQCSYSGISGAIKVGNPNLATMVSEIASKVGIPSSILMGIIRIESIPQFTNQNLQYLENDYDATISSAGAIGISQFMPGTFKEVFGANKVDIAEKFGKQSMINYIEPQQPSPPKDSILRITSIRDSLILTAYKIKNTKRDSANPWNETEVKEVARRYHGACNYPNSNQSYCEDLAQSFSNCKETPPSIAPEEGLVSGWVNGINGTCVNGVVTRYGLACLDAVLPPITEPTKGFLATSAIQSDYLQCVGWVQGVIKQQLPVLYAYQLIYTGAPGYRYIQKDVASGDIREGDVAVWSATVEASAGHVAFVLRKVDERGFEVAEANFGTLGKVQKRVVPLSTNNLAGWLRKI